MTVNELIAKLEKIKDKDMSVMLRLNIIKDDGYLDFNFSNYKDNIKVVIARNVPMDNFKSNNHTDAVVISNTY